LAKAKSGNSYFWFDYIPESYTSRSHHYTSIVIVKIVVLIPLGDVLNRFPFLFVLVLLLHPLLELLRHALLSDGLRLAGYDIKVGAVLFSYVLRTHVSVHLFGLVQVSQYLTSTSVLISVTYRIVAQTTYFERYPLAFLLFSICTFWCCSLFFSSFSALSPSFCHLSCSRSSRFCKRAL
jgi:hypothetical protein